MNQVVSIENGNVTQKVQPFHIPLTLGDANYIDKLDAGQGGTMFFDVTYKNRSSVPAHISHRVVVTAPEGGESKTFTAIDEPIPVDPKEPIVLSPPLKGTRWLDGNGCCKEIGPHRGVISPINGAMEPAEDFAIGFMQLDGNGRAYNGNVRDVKSFACYDAPVYAAAPGKVIEVVKDLPNQIPGANPEGLPAAWQAAGNHIIVDIGRGRYVMYAHLVPQSPTVRVGDLVRAGSVIGRLGNSGNTDSPHLHFQVMDKPSSLGAHGLPFYFDSMKRVATYKGSLAEEEKQFLSGEPLNLDVASSAPFHNRMPLTLDLLDF
jgi:murein DD-endopeptidase MepM/ murein hydrolase activator NlpD